MEVSANEKLHFALEYLKSIREEINLRINQHHYLWIYKIISSGALLSFILSGQIKSNVGVEVYACVVLPYISFVFDVLILTNIGVIRRLTTYISEIIEKDFFPQGWECWSRGIKDFKNPKSDWGVDWLLTIVFTLVITVISWVLTIKFGSNVINRLVIVIYILTILFFLFVYVKMRIDVTQKSQFSLEVNMNDNRGKKTKSK